MKVLVADWAIVANVQVIQKEIINSMGCRHGIKRNDAWILLFDTIGLVLTFLVRLCLLRKECWVHKVIHVGLPCRQDRVANG